MILFMRPNGSNQFIAVLMELKTRESVVHPFVQMAVFLGYKPRAPKIQPFAQMAVFLEYKPRATEIQPSAQMAVFCRDRSIRDVFCNVESQHPKIHDP